ncbi:NAD-dependent epimerase/dehydratase family protein [Actinomycetospora lemnae]|uniref:SDR family oxidoreductase n=1 Tax=Actinomycetospora lemnae TaxID=3019891 RepID=A0ABT5SYC3_9PSEU|nr:SDR family oxidoreductase [Actinomycetospora sp. DW7H6]MDD7966708.1 SDR family oxidoreductase [Actinomycetospora sp. DW7H6]
MRVLLTGHQGYLGTLMAPQLTEAGHEVTGLDSGLYADCVLGELPAPEPPALAVDLRDVTVDQLAGFDAVVHLAALSNDPLGALAPQHTYDINHHASTRLARLAKEAGVGRFVYASTCSVYGASGTEDVLDEEAPMKPVTPYAESKVRVEADLVDMADDDFVPVSMRNATAFGFSPRLRADIVLNNLVGHALLSNRILVMSDGTPWRPLAHARDIGGAVVAALAAPADAVRAQAFNVGSTENNVQVRDIADAVKVAVPEAELVITGETGGDPRSYRVDFTKIGKFLPDFRAGWTVADGAAELVREYRARGLTQEAFDRRFTRLAVLKDRQAAGSLDATLRPAGG